MSMAATVIWECKISGKSVFRFNGLLLESARFSCPVRETDQEKRSVHQGGALFFWPREDQLDTWQQRRSAVKLI